ncbi:MAG: hypothetical protein JST68_11940 [Bacteroidetes bacterium]|nr:hypothetical protein [Bacteroidota bacterium]
MNDFFSKLENFLFDILGLILPGAIFLLILLSPILFIDMTNVPDSIAASSILLSALKTISNILKDYWSHYPKSAVTIATILAYLMGHAVKVFSRIKYEFLTAFFDETLNKAVLRLYNKGKNRLFPAKTPPSKTYLRLKALFKPVKIFIGHLFTFSAPDYFPNDETLRQKCLDQFKTKLSVDFPADDRSLNKISGVIASQESVKTLGPFFLAKYNLYRSLSLIFLFTIVYYIYFFKVAAAYITPASHEISCLIFISPVILWFTFHVKYKRYWTLYGDERIMSLFYFLNKKTLNEGR